MFIEANPNARRQSSYPKPYFKNCFAAYVVGLVTTVVVMHTFKAAQPALLYLSPACILSVLATGTIKGQFTDVFQYSSASEENQEKEDDNKSDAGRDERKKTKSAKKDSATKLENSSEAEDEASGSSTTRRRKVATRASTSGDDATGGEGPGAVTGEEDYVEVTTTKLRLGKK
jgi:minor histocompatibility antigen H13